MPDQLFGPPIIRAKTTNEKLADWTSGRKYDEDPSLLSMLAALFPTLAGTVADQGMTKAMVPLTMLTKYRKFYHGSPNEFTKFRAGPIDTEFPVMPSPGAVYVTPNPRHAALEGENVYEVAVNPNLKVSDWWGGPDVEDQIRHRFGDEGVKEYDRLNALSRQAMSDLEYNPVSNPKGGIYPAPELIKRGIGGIRYDGGINEGPRGWSLAVADPNDVTILRRLSDVIRQRLLKMNLK